MWTLGINSVYHEPSACLIKDGQIIAAAEEERFNRFRHGKVANLLNPHCLPENAIRFCLEKAGISAGELNHIGYSFVPEKRLKFNVGIDQETIPGIAGTPECEEKFHDLLNRVPEELSKLLGVDIKDRFHWIAHHLCHAASAYFVSPFNEAAVLSVDGIGEATTIWFGTGKDNELQVLKEIMYPNSLGFLWTKFSRFLGFGEYGQWKVMGLSAYGDADRYYDQIRSFVHYNENGSFEIDGKYLQFRVNTYSEFEELFGEHRDSDDEVDKRHMDIAASLQRVTNEALVSFAEYLHEETGLPSLCLAGGVALNCVTNNLLLESGPFENVFVQPAANDAGTALGAAFYIWNHVLKNEKKVEMSHVYWGPEYSNQEIDESVYTYSLEANKLTELEKKVAELLADGEIVAWFQGRMEYGPRALGNRSILADPRRSDIVHLINERIKHREFFRPFAASVLDDQAEEWFEINRRSLSDRFMSFARLIKKDKIGQIPAVTHYDGSCRLQLVDPATNPKYHRLISEFNRITGVPLILNTSFNDSEPIICSPEDAFKTCAKAGINWLAMGDHLLEIQGVPEKISDIHTLESPEKEDWIDDEVLKTPVMLAFRSR